MKGHIFAKIYRWEKRVKLELNAGDRFMQGVISPYFKRDGRRRCADAENTAGTGDTGSSMKDRDFESEQKRHYK